VLVVDDVPVLDGLLDRRVARMRAVLERRERVALAREPQVLEAVVAVGREASGDWPMRLEISSRF